MIKFLRLVSLLFLMGWISTVITGCNPLYVARAAYEESKILIRRQDIQEIIDSPEADNATKEKLKLVLEARGFAESQGLTPKDSFTTYSKYDRDMVSWVVIGSKKDSFTPYTWWFPIIGSVPYKGFFEKEDAEKEAQALQDKVYETAVRGAAAFSTLGWFNDPILTPTLKRHPVEIIDTIIHESVHSTVWIPNHVDFNESLANVVGTEEAVRFCEQFHPELLDHAKKAREVEYKVAAVVSNLYRRLDEAYRSSDGFEEKLKQKAQIFSEEILSLRNEFPTLKVLQEANNAEILQMYLYTKELYLFRQLYGKSKSLKEFIGFMEEIKSEVSSNSLLKPFDLLKQRVSADAIASSPH